MHARNNLKYFFNYIMFTNVYAIDPEVYNCKLTHHKCSNTIFLELEFIKLLFLFSPVIHLCPTLCHPMDCSMPGFPCPSPTPWAYSNSCPSSRWCHPTTSSSVIPFSSCLQSFPASGSFQMSQSFPSCGQILEFQLQHQSFQWIFRTDLLYDGLVGSPCSPRDSQESSSTPQFKSMNSSVLSFLYGPAVTSIHGYWKNHSLD